ncbi:MAG: GAF domain-containing sensor histidine kinase [Clostridia bacterium]
MQPILYRIAQLVWAVVAVGAISVFAVSLMLRYSILLIPCNPAEVCREPIQLSLEEAASLRGLGMTLPFYSSYIIILDTLQGLASFGIAAIIYWKKSRDPFAWFVSIALMTGTVPRIQAAVEAFPSLDWLYTAMTFIASSYLVFFYVFPNGRFAPHWTKYVTMLWVFFSIGRTFLKGSWIDPFTWPPLWNFGGWIVFHIIALAAQIIRYRVYATAEEKQQIKWFVYGLASMVMGIVLESILVNTPHLLESGTTDVVLKMILTGLATIGTIMVPVSIGVAIQRYRLWDIDHVINRTLVYASTSIGIIGIYVLIVVGFGVLFQSQGSFLVSLVATGIIAAVVNPMRNLLQRAIDRIMYGERDRPYVVLTRLGQRLESLFASQDVLHVVVETLAQTLKLPYVAVSIKADREEIVAVFGQRVEPVLRVPLIYQSEHVGQLLLSPRASDEVFPLHERKLLAEIARQVGIAVHNVQLTTDLQRARERLVTAREEERRRLRRDLHDSLGPELASLSMLTAAAQNLLTNRPEDVQDILAQMNQKLTSVIGDIRQIVYALRPPVLDELGLAYAIREQADTINRPDGQLRIVVDGPDQLPVLPAAVEVAAYRIVQEAITNVVRHAGARQCHIRFQVDEALHLEVKDDGVGWTEKRKGVGLNSMKERAEELRGTFQINNHQDGGTMVYVRLPLSRNE